MLPFSEACERNKDPILAVLRKTFASSAAVLEIGSGTGQHAVYFSEHLPHLIWHPTERPESIADLQIRIAAAGLANLRMPVPLEVSQKVWPVRKVDVFTANTLHIMSWPQVIAQFDGIHANLVSGGVFAVYGPFRYGGAYTSDSNRRFDEMLKQRDPASGLRDIDDLKPLAKERDLQLLEDHDLPANNRLLVFGMGA